MASFHEQLPATASQDEVESAVARWNADDRVDGILVQLPLPGRPRLQAGSGADRPGQGRGRVPPGQRRPPGCQPARPASVHAGRRDGAAARLRDRRSPARRPWSSAARTSSASRWRCCSCTRAPPSPSPTRARATWVRSRGAQTSWWRPSDVREMITGDMIKPGAVVIDVGINRTDAGLVGDVDFASAARGGRRRSPRYRRCGSDDDRDAALEHAGGRSDAPRRAGRRYRLIAQLARRHKAVIRFRLDPLQDASARCI